jgi:hypothetical protein
MTTSGQKRKPGASSESHAGSSGGVGPQGMSDPIKIALISTGGGIVVALINAAFTQRFEGVSNPLVAAIIGAVIGAFAALAILLVILLFSKKNRPTEGEKMTLRSVVGKKWLVLLLAPLVGAGSALLAQKLPPNARLTKEAWEAFNNKDWQTAIKKADECIDQFKDDADDIQAQLEKDHASVGLGTVSAKEKADILKRGPLNDVGTAYWIKGQAEEKLGRNDDAKQAYQSASKYTYARCYDDSYDGFWAPADKARGRLRHL